MSAEFIKDFMAGGVAASIGKTVVAPVERIKLILQVQDISRQIKPKKRYKGTIDAFIRIPKEEGIGSLWRGNLASIYKYFPLQAFSFSFKSVFSKYFLLNVDKNEHMNKYILLNLMSGGLAGAVSVAIIYPLDFARTRWVKLVTITAGFLSYPFDTVRRRMMMQAGLKKEDQMYRNTIHCWVVTFRTGGVYAFFLGSMANILRATGGAITLVLYDEIRNIFK